MPQCERLLCAAAACLLVLSDIVTSTSIMLWAHVRSWNKAVVPGFYTD